MAALRLKSPSDFDLVLQNETFIFDLDGTIWCGPAGETLTPDVVKAIHLLRGLGKKIAWVTNNATYTRQAYLDKLHRLGLIYVTLEEIYTCGSATATYLQRHVLPGIADPAKRNVYLIGQESMEQELDAVGIKYTGGTDPADMRILAPRDFSDINPDPSIGVVCYTFDIAITYLKLGKAFMYLGSNPDCQLVMTNDDYSLGGARGGILPGEGALASVLLGARKDLKPTIVGKPYQPLLDIVREQIHFDPATTVMVGDRLETDIMWGKRAGLKTLLVLTGNSQEHDLVGLGPGELPDYVADCVGSLIQSQIAIDAATKAKALPN